MRRLIVVDTNVWVSRMLNPLSVPGKAAAKALEQDRILASAATLKELEVVLQRPKIASYIPPGAVELFLEQINSVAIPVAIPFPIHACRDARDDKFLEVAVHGRADAIVTGDADLLGLDPFRGVAIMTPAAYLEME